MFLSALLYTGALVAVIGIVAMLRKKTRRHGALIFAAGLALVLIAMFWPAPEERVTTVVSGLDEFMPRWQFDEKHEIRINASQRDIYWAIRKVTAPEIRYFNLLTSIRCLGRCREKESILHAPAAKPIIDVALNSGFMVMVDDFPRELAIGSHVAPQTFALMNFRIDTDGHVTTETRVFARTDAARRKFAIYWRLIRPGSGIIRRSWLEAIKRRAEAKK